MSCTYSQSTQTRTMKVAVVVLAVLALACAVPVKEVRDLTEEDKLALEQARNARYRFESQIVDNIKDLVNERYEERDGLNLKGSFSYSDGYVLRTVNYVADENGYRIESDTSKPLDGPKENPEGEASVRTLLDNTESQYTVRGKKIE